MSSQITVAPESRWHSWLKVTVAVRHRLWILCETHQRLGEDKLPLSPKRNSESAYVRVSNFLCPEVTQQRDAGALDGLQVLPCYCAHAAMSCRQRVKELYLLGSREQSRTTWNSTQDTCTGTHMCMPPGCHSCASIVFCLLIYCRWEGTVEQLPRCPTITSFHPHSTSSNNFPSVQNWCGISL